MKTVDYNNNHDNWIGFMIGMISGIVKFLFIDPALFSRFLEAGITAVVCGVLGMLGKDVYVWVKNKMLSKKQ
jgi:hypothetical protein